MRRRTVKKKRSKSKHIMSQKRKTVPTNIPLKKSKQSNVKFCMISYQGNADFAKLTK